MKAHVVLYLVLNKYCPIFFTFQIVSTFLISFISVYINRYHKSKVCATSLTLQWITSKSNYEPKKARYNLLSVATMKLSQK